MPDEILVSVRAWAAYAPPTEVSQTPSQTPTSLPESDIDPGPRDPDSHSSVLKFSTKEQRDKEYNKPKRLTLK
jgi:hypothetical protein